MLVPFGQDGHPGAVGEHDARRDKDAGQRVLRLPDAGVVDGQEEHCGMGIRWEVDLLVGVTVALC